MNKVVLLCRPGFEKECAAEITDKAGKREIFGFARVKENAGYVIYECYQPEDGEKLISELPFSSLIFARQWFVVGELLQHLPPEDRITPIVGMLQGVVEKGGWLLDRFGSKRVYFWSIFIWSVFTLLQGFVDIFSGFGIIVALFTLRFLVGLAESPSFPGNSRIVAAWFPAQERGTAVAIFNSAQYFATVIFAPIMGWLTHEVGWSHVFFFMGGLGIIISFIWLKVIHEPNNHPGVNKKELEYIAEGGALINMDQKDTKAKVPFSVKWGQIKQLLGSRMMIGVYIGQYCINALTYFFITWFPVYLVQARGMSILKAGFVASVPAVCGFIGGVLGGIISDWLMRRTGFLNIARKTPIVLGMLLSMVMVFCNYVNVEWMIIGFMVLAFFGKGIGALGWAVMADTAPKEISGLSGGLFNMFGNISGIVTPIAIGYIVGTTGSFNGALIYVGVHALVAIISYLVLVGDIKRIELKPVAGQLS
ncbi:glucarate permease [Salmonella enterica subsp. enterica serovar Typhi]|nr:glucarate permease [Salmonella enterica subsp. enterica serovar Typhi]